MRTVALQQVENQRVTSSLGGQPVRLNVYQKSTGIFTDIYNNDALVLAGVIARQGVRMIRDTYFGFIGDFAFIDTAPPDSGPEDPQWQGLGTRWLLFYLEAGDFVRDV